MPAGSVGLMEEKEEEQEDEALKKAEEAELAEVLGKPQTVLTNAYRRE